MCPHPCEDVQVKCWSWGHTEPPEVAEESCWKTSSDIVKRLVTYKAFTQDAYLWNLTHSSFDGICVNVYTQNQRIAIKHQFRVLN